MKKVKIELWVDTNEMEIEVPDNATESEIHNTVAMEVSTQFGWDYSIEEE